MNDKKSGTIWTTFGILLFIIVIFVLARYTKFIEQILFQSGPLAPIVAIILYPLLAPTPITTDPITIIIGVIYGPFAGVLISWIGNTLAAMVEYFLGNRIEKATRFEKSKNKLPFGLGKLPVNSIPFLVFGRMIPGYGGKVISILAGMYKVPIKRYIWTTALSTLCGAIVLSFGGFALIKIIKISKIFGN